MARHGARYATSVRERADGSGGRGVTWELLDGWGCVCRVHENPTDRSGADYARCGATGEPTDVWPCVGRPRVGNAVVGRTKAEPAWAGLMGRELSGRAGHERADKAGTGRAATGQAGSGTMGRAGGDRTEAMCAGGADGRSFPAGGRGGGCGRRGQAGYPYGRPGWCRSAGRAGGGVDAGRAITAGDGSGGAGGGRASP